MHYEEVDSKGRRTLCRTENYANFHEGFNQLFRGKEILGILGQLSGEEMVLFKEKINYKVCESQLLPAVLANSSKPPVLMHATLPIAGSLGWWVQSTCAQMTP